MTLLTEDLAAIEDPVYRLWVKTRRDEIWRNLVGPSSSSSSSPSCSSPSFSSSSCPPLEAENTVGDAGDEPVKEAEEFADDSQEVEEIAVEDTDIVCVVKDEVNSSSSE
ncbi:unnamed protein product [Mucor hiemalis]